MNNKLLLLILLGISFPFFFVNGEENVNFKSAFTSEPDEPFKQTFDTNGPCVCVDIYDPVCVITPFGLISYSNDCVAECDGWSPSNFVDCEAPCLANFYYSEDENSALTFHFTDVSLGFNVTDWFWTFGDGSSSTEQDPSHTFEADGSYMISLTITSIDCTHNFSQEIVATTALAVEWLDFTATQIEKNVLLEWQTINEKDNAYFNIQKSLNGQDFETIGKVESKAQTATTSYTFIDANPDLGFNYYRLQQVDTNGKTSFSKIASQYFETKEASSVKIYPNPIKDRLHLDFEDSTAFVKGELWDANGVLMRDFNINQDMVLNIKDLAVGVYYLKLVGEKNRIVEKLIKQ